jgi:hypothetical protein
MNTLRAEAQRGFPSFSGANISGTIPVTQKVVDELVATSGLLSSIEILDNDQIAVRVMGISVSATIVGVEPPLKLILKLPFWASALASVAGKLTSVGPQVRLKGAYLYVDVAAFPQLSAYRDIWKHVTLVKIRTSAGRMIISFQLVIA